MRARAEGFSLLEVLIAMVILTVGAASLLALFAAAAATHKRSVDRTQAALVAEEVLSEVQGRYNPGTKLEDLRAALDGEHGLPKTIRGYRWKVLLIRPADGDQAKGDRGPSPKAKAPSRARAKTEGAKSAGTKAGAALKTKVAKGPAPAADAQPSAPGDDWTEDELLVRIIVGWSQSGRESNETFDSLILPRPIPLGAKKK